MHVNAIKLRNGTYWAGCNKKESKTLLGAQLYKSEKAAMNVIEKSVNFPDYEKEGCKIVSALLMELDEDVERS